MADNYYLKGPPPAYIPEGPIGDAIRAKWPSMGAGPCQVGFIPEGWTAEQVLSGEYTRAQEEMVKREAEHAELSRRLQAATLEQLTEESQEVEVLPDPFGDEPVAITSTLVTEVQDSLAAIQAEKARLKEERRAENQRLHAEKQLAKRGRAGL